MEYHVRAYAHITVTVFFGIIIEYEDSESAQQLVHIKFNSIVSPKCYS